MDWKKYIEKHRMGRRETKKKNYFIVCGLKCPRAFILSLRLYNLTPWMNGYLQADNWKWTHFRLQVCPCVVFFFWCVTFTSWMTVSLKQETLERSEVTVVPFTCPSLQSLFFNALISLNGDYENIHMAEFRAATNVVASRRKRGRHVSVAHQE